MKSILALAEEGLMRLRDTLYQTRDRVVMSSKGGHPGTLAESVPECPPLAKIVPDCPSGGQSGTISSQFALCGGQSGTASRTRKEGEGKQFLPPEGQSGTLLPIFVSKWRTLSQIPAWSKEGGEGVPNEGLLDLS